MFVSLCAAECERILFSPQLFLCFAVWVAASVCPVFSQVFFLFSVKRMKFFRLFHIVRLAVPRANKVMCLPNRPCAPVSLSLPHASERSKCLSAAISAESFSRLQNFVSVLVCSVLTSLPSECISVLIVVNAYVLNKISLVVLQRVMFTYLTVGKCFDVI